MCVQEINLCFEVKHSLLIKLTAAPDVSLLDWMPITIAVEKEFCVLELCKTNCYCYAKTFQGITVDCLLIILSGLKGPTTSGRSVVYLIYIYIYIHTTCFYM